MRARHSRSAFSVALLLALSAPAAHAQFAVIDIAAVNQLVSQVPQLEQHLATARSQLTDCGRSFLRRMCAPLRWSVPWAFSLR